MVVGETPKPLGAVGQALEKEERKWRLVYSGGLAPEVRTYEYVTKGRHYLLSVSVFYDTKGNIHPFGNIRLTVNYRKTYEFKSYKQLKKYLEKHKVPLTGIEELISLWVVSDG